MADRVVHRDAAAHRPARHVHRLAPPAKRSDQRLDVVGPVGQAAGGIDGFGFRAAKATKVRRDRAKAVRQLRGHVAPETAGDEVAVNEQERHAVLWSADPAAGAQSISVDVDPLHGKPPQSQSGWAYRPSVDVSRRYFG